MNGGLMRNETIKKVPSDFQLETTSIWSFPERGSWATHDPFWRGNCSPYVVRNIILRYSVLGDLLLDNFAGGGTTLVEAKLLKRNCIGLDVNEEAISRCRRKIDFDVAGESSAVEIRKGDARNLVGICDDSIDLIFTHPPYANIIKYDERNPNDISNLEAEPFLLQMRKVSNESFRVLKKGKFCTVLIGDIRRHGFVFPLGFRLLEEYLNTGFLLKEVIIKQQHNCKATSYWLEKSIKQNFLLLAHEYLFVLKKP